MSSCRRKDKPANSAAVRAAVPHGAGGMDDVLRGETVAAGDLGLARLTAVQRAALGQQLRPRGAVYRAVDPAAAKQRAVRRVDYRVHALMRDIALNYLYNSHYAILTSTLPFSADSMICDELSPRRAMMPSAI